MKFHHVGLACSAIEDALDFLRRCHGDVEHTAPVYDEGQQAWVCMATAPDGTRLELVSGKRVEGLVKRGVRLYHTCYEVDDLDAAVATFVAAGSLLLAEPCGAPLFGNRRVAFVASPLGIVEFLEAAERPVQDAPAGP